MKKIAIVTLNPGVDRIVYLDRPTAVGGHNRSTHTMMNQGSKGANQALLLKNLGAFPEYFSFTGGAFGPLCESFTDAAGISSHYFPTSCGVRLNIKVIDSDGVGTEFNEKGGPLTENELKALACELISGKFDVISLCGSFPQGVENSVENTFANMLKDSVSTLILDTSGNGLSRFIKEKPALIKPNREELRALGFDPPAMWKDALDACGKIYEKYKTAVICTLDRDGSVYYGDEGAFRIEVEPKKIVGFSGAGDAYLAAFIYKRFLCGESIEESLAFGAAASVAKIGLEGSLMPCSDEIGAAKGSVSVGKV